MTRLVARVAALAALVLAMGCDDEPTGPSTANALTFGLGQEITGISGGANSRRLYRVIVPAGGVSLTVETHSGSGDVDLMVRRERVPTLLESDCESFNDDNDDGCSIPNPSAGSYYILLFGAEAYSGVTLTARLTNAPAARLESATTLGR